MNWDKAIGDVGYAIGRPTEAFGGAPFNAFGIKGPVKGIKIGGGTPSWMNAQPPEWQQSEYEKLLKQRALSPGASQSAGYQLEQQGLAGQQAIGQARAEAARGAGTNMSSLAMRGGLSSGARERALQSAQQQGMNAQQGIYGGMLQGRAGILAQDEANKQQVLGNLLDLENQRYGAKVGAWGNQQAARGQYEAARAPGIGNLFGLTNLWS